MAVDIGDAEEERRWLPPVGADAHPARRLGQLAAALVHAGVPDAQHVAVGANAAGPEVVVLDEDRPPRILRHYRVLARLDEIDEVRLRGVGTVVRRRRLLDILL